MKLQLLARIKNFLKNPEVSVDKPVTKKTGKSKKEMSMGNLANPNSAIDAVSIKGVLVLVYNNTSEGRSSLDIAVSTDAGKTWSHRLNLENEAGEEFSYPAIILSTDDMLRVTYTWKRKKIKYFEINTMLLGIK